MMIIRRVQVARIFRYETFGRNEEFHSHIKSLIAKLILIFTILLRKASDSNKLIQ